VGMTLDTYSYINNSRWRTAEKKKDQMDKDIIIIIVVVVVIVTFVFGSMCLINNVMLKKTRNGRRACILHYGHNDQNLFLLAPCC
jgi:hypothetical protein